MIISNQEIGNILRITRANPYSRTNRELGRNNSLGQKQDHFQISAKAQDFQKIIEQTLKLPEVEADKINGLKDRVQQGDYQVSGRDIAEKMIGRSLVDTIVGGNSSDAEN